MQPRSVLVLGLVLLCSSQSACALAREAPEAAAVSASSEPAAAGDAKASPIGRKRIIESALTLDASVPRRARLELEQKVTELGGFVESLSASGSGSQASSQLVVRVPEARLGALLAFARGLGQVTSETQEARDVTREYVDVEARLRNLARTEERLLGLLGQRTGTLADVISVETELSRVRGESEVLTAQLRALDADVAMAKLTVSIYPAHVAVAMPDDTFAPLRALWADAGGVVAGSASALLAAMAATVRVLLALLPWLPLVALAWLGLRKLRRVRVR